MENVMNVNGEFLLTLINPSLVVIIILLMLMVFMAPMVNVNAKATHPVDVGECE